MSEDKFTFIDLFAGCGGLSEGVLSSNKFEALAHVEWELPMVSTLRNRLTQKWGHSKTDSLKRVIHFDIQKSDELINGNWSDESKKSYSSSNHDDIINNGLSGLIGKQKVNLIIGGPPCQAYSIHGRATDSKSMEDDYRNYLFESFAKTVGFFKPDVFVFENVPGILSAKPGGIPVTERIYSAFKKIGYNILESNKLDQTVFNCSNFGVPQNRKRVLIIGVKNNSSFKVDDFYKSINKNEDKSNKQTIRDAIGMLPKIYPLKKAIKEEGKNISHYSNNNTISHHIPRYNNNRDINIFKEWVEKKMNYISHKEKVEFYYKKTGRNTLYSKYRNLEWEKQSYTIVAHLYKDGLMFIHPDSEQARSITIREAALLMTFPIDYKFIGSNAYCYKMIGNAVPVAFAKVIGESIFNILSEKK
jgi:DNA (cytosine-5)-methyltransferase 1